MFVIQDWLKATGFQSVRFLIFCFPTFCDSDPFKIIMDACVKYFGYAIESQDLEAEMYKTVYFENNLRCIQTNLAA